MKTSTQRQEQTTPGPDNLNCIGLYGVFEIHCMPSRLYTYLYSLCLLSTHTCNFTAGFREFGEFDPHRKLGQLLQCSVQQVSVCWL